MAAIVDKKTFRAAPYPPSKLISRVQWAPKESIVRKAKGGDNWPITWADDDRLYSAYGDANGFEPFLKEKLSMGLVAVEGPASDFRGINIRSSSFETKGDGARGRKASGMLMVDGTLYVLVRNVSNSRAWLVERSWPNVDLERVEVRQKLRLSDVLELWAELRRGAR